MSPTAAPGRRCLVTGGAGFVGQAVARRLTRAGHAVRILELPGHPELAAIRRTHPAIEIVAGDVTRPDDVRRAAAGTDAIVHTAALLDSIAPRAEFRRVNVDGTAHVCRAALEHRVAHLVYVSTSDVFGIPAPADVITEASPYRRWHEPYADTKIEASALVLRRRREDGLAATILYPGWVYGPGDRRLVPTVVRIAAGGVLDVWPRTRLLELYLCYIDDLVDAVLRVLATPASVGEDFLVLDDHTGLSIEDFVRFFADELGVPLRTRRTPYPAMLAVAWASQTLARCGLIARPLLSTTDVKAFGHEFHFSARKAREQLGWTPAVSPREGLRRAWEWYRAQDPTVLLGR